MRSRYYIISLFTLLFFCSTEIDYGINKREKKLNNFLAKSYKPITLVKEEIVIPDSLLIYEENKAYKLSTSGDSLLGFLLFNRALGCRVGGCSADGGSKSGDNQDPYYFATIYNADFSIREINVLEYYSEYGVEITSRRWLKQFANKVVCGMDLKEKIDGISGATISVNSLLAEVKWNCNLTNYLSSL